jgi:hypothetical protein
LLSAFSLFCIAFPSPGPPPPKVALLRTSQGSELVATEVVTPDCSSWPFSLSRSEMRLLDEEKMKK